MSKKKKKKGHRVVQPLPNRVEVVEDNPWTVKVLGFMRDQIGRTAGIRDVKNGKFSRRYF